MSDLVAGLILNLEFHQKDKWVATLCTPRLVDAVIERFNCVVIENQNELDRYYNQVDFLISMGPGWGAPVLDYRNRILGIPTRIPKLSYIFYSDPHGAQWREKYFLRNKLGFVLAYYYKPTLFHFPRIPRERIIHFPWSIPDDYITTKPIVFNGKHHITTYGGSQSKAYELRNWCRSFDFVFSTTYSGVENRKLSNREFLDWLRIQDAIIAAGSDSPKYRLTMPKYFEIPASGALLFAQETDDLERLGFKDMENCVVFNRDNFVEKSRAYLSDPISYLPIRERGRDLIRTKHSLSVRMDEFESHVREHLK